MAVRLTCNQEVLGSSPRFSSNKYGVKKKASTWRRWVIANFFKHHLLSMQKAAPPVSRIQLRESVAGSIPYKTSVAGS